MLGLSAVIALAAFLRYRKPKAAPAPKRAAPPPAVAIDHTGIADQLRTKPSRSMSLDFLQEPKPPTTKENP